VVAVAIVAALVGVRPERLTRAQFDSAREQLIATTVRLDRDHPGRAGILSTRLYGAEVTLFHAGVIETPPRKRMRSRRLPICAARISGVTSVTSPNGRARTLPRAC
jgi:hypothetical protein